MRVSIFLVLPVLFAFVACIPDLAFGCPNCKEAYIEAGTGASVSSGYSTSILLMMTVPFLVLGGFSLTIWLSAKKKRAAEERG